MAQLYLGTRHWAALASIQAHRFKLRSKPIVCVKFNHVITNCKVPSSTSPGNTLNRHHHPHLRYCDSFTKRNPRSLCTQLQRIHQRLSEAVPPSQDNEIAPRFGAEKRLVPSGPNPLHN
ncbi:CLAVATA3/ESR (CLE)-related protein 9, partial [Mucuna pruriens]